MTVVFSSETTEARKKCVIISQVLRKELLTPKPVSWGNIFQELWKNEDSFRCRKTKKICYQQIKGMTKGSYLNQKEMITDRILNILEGRKNKGKGKNMHEYIFLLLLHFLNYISLLKKRL